MFFDSLGKAPEGPTRESVGNGNALDGRGSATVDTISVFGVINTASFSFGAILVCLSCLVYMVLHGHFEKSQSKLLLVIVIVLLVNAVSSMTAEVLKDYMLESEAAKVSVFVANYLYFVAHTMLAPMVCVYFLTVCGRPAKRRSITYVVTAIPFVVTEALAVINPLTHWVYYYGPDLTFTRNWAVYVIYAVAAYYMVYGLVTLLFRWQALTSVKRRAIVYFFIMVCLGVVIQMVEPEVRIELFAESIAVMGVALFVENEDEFIDSETGVYNRNALKANLDMFMNPQSPIYVIVVRVTNADSFTRIAGSAQARQYMVSVVASHIKEIVPWYRVYRTAPAQYALFDPTIDDQGALDIAHKISERFEQSWDYHGINIDLDAIVAIARIPDDLSTPNDVLYFIDSPVPAASKKKVLERSDLGYFMHRADVERAVQRGLDESNYEVYYQPINDASGEICEAEALMRLHDPELGDITPVEFIEAAERIGFIEGIGDFALREVCDFLASGVPQRLGLKRICVNLSVIQCMQSEFPGHVAETIEEYGVSPQLVGFEITESVAASNYEFLDRMMRQVRADGHCFSMDDYGTGYSNMHSLITLNFDIVKIDKSVLWDAEKSETGMAILQNSVDLLHNTGCMVLVEGVETDVQLEMLRRLGVDLIQGFYFAHPMPRDEFVAFVEQHRAR